MMTSKQGDDGVESMLRERERGRDVKNVHGKIGRESEGERQKRLGKQEKTSTRRARGEERSDAKTFHSSFTPARSMLSDHVIFTGSNSGEL